MTEPNPVISVVVPVYLGETSIEELYRRVAACVHPYELVLVDDASPDGSWEKIEALAAKDPAVKAIRFTRNFGQHQAITAGLEAASGDWIVVMDCDLQDRPEDIAKLHAKALEGFDCVVGLRGRSADPLARRMLSRGFYAVFGFLLDRSVDPRVGAFRIVSRRAARQYLALGERSRLFGNLMEWLGFPTATVEVSHERSARGRSSYSAGKLLDLAFGALLVHSARLLRVSVYGGFACAALSFAYGGYVLVGAFSHRSPVAGWSSLIVSLFFFSGIIISMLGLIGLYIGKTLEEVRGRPLYVIRDALNLSA